MRNWASRLHDELPTDQTSKNLGLTRACFTVSPDTSVSATMEAHTKQGLESQNSLHGIEQL